MLTSPTIARPSLRAIGLALPLVLLIAACGAAARPSPSPVETARPTPTAVPGASGEPGVGGPGTGGAVGGGGGAGSGAGGDPGSGIGIFPIPPMPADNPLLGQATNVTPKPGRLNPHPANVQLVRAAVDATGVQVELRWWSGVEECYATDSVTVQRDDDAKTIRLTVLEGSNAADVACIDIAMLKATVVNLGALGAGTWTISAEGDARPIQVEVK